MIGFLKFWLFYNHTGTVQKNSFLFNFYVGMLHLAKTFDYFVMCLMCKFKTMNLFSPSVWHSQPSVCNTTLVQAGNRFRVQIYIQTSNGGFYGRVSIGACVWACVYHLCACACLFSLRSSMSINRKHSSITKSIPYL
jgi:hypothetical protein